MKQIEHKNLFFIVVLLVLLSNSLLMGQRAAYKLNSPINSQVTRPNTLVGFIQHYILINKNDIATTPLFSGDAAEQYKAFSINNESLQTVPKLTVGANITAIDGSFVDTSMALSIDVKYCNDTTGNIFI